MNLTSQSPRVPIGYADYSGQKVPVYIDPAWYRYLSIELFQRNGGSEALTNAELQDAVGGLQILPVQEPFTPAQDVSPVAAAYVPDRDDGDGRLAAVEAELTALRVAVRDLQMGNSF